MSVRRCVALKGRLPDTYTNGLTELRFMVGQTYVLPFSGVLVLGYEDDGYSDNGY